MLALHFAKAGVRVTLLHSADTHELRARAVGSSEHLLSSPSRGPHHRHDPSPDGMGQAVPDGSQLGHLRRDRHGLHESSQSVGLVGCGSDYAPARDGTASPPSPLSCGHQASRPSTIARMRRRSSAVSPPQASISRARSAGTTSDFARAIPPTAVFPGVEVARSNRVAPTFLVFITRFPQGMLPGVDWFRDRPIDGPGLPESSPDDEGKDFRVAPTANNALACLGKPDPRAFDAAWIRIPTACQPRESRAPCTAAGLEDGSAHHQRGRKAMAAHGPSRAAGTTAIPSARR